MVDVVLESVRSIILACIFIFLLVSGRSRFEHLRVGWRVILSGFALLVFGSIIDITDNFENLNKFVVIGDTPTEAFLEKFVGSLAGFALLGLGMFMWIPKVQGLSDLVEYKTQDIMKANQELVREIALRKLAETKKLEFIADICHELRTPLTSIKGALGIIQSGTTGDLTDKNKSLVDICYRNSGRLASLIDDLLELEKIQTGNMPYNKVPVDIANIVREAVEEISTFDTKSGDRIRLLEIEGSARVMGNPDRLKQVLSNLLSNAIKFSPNGGQIKISVEAQDDVVCIAVRDNGVGIPLELREHIFERFTQAEAGEARQIRGTGLGLNISRAIIELHGGSLFFETEIGEGTTFYVKLPLSRTGIGNSPEAGKQGKPAKT